MMLQLAMLLLCLSVDYQYNEHVSLSSYPLSAVHFDTLRYVVAFNTYSM